VIEVGSPPPARGTATASQKVIKNQMRQVVDGERLSPHGKDVLGLDGRDSNCREIYVSDPKGNMLFTIEDFHLAVVKVPAAGTVELRFSAGPGEMAKTTVRIEHGVVEYAEPEEKGAAV
jgi:hypothetical protein